MEWFEQTAPLVAYVALLLSLMSIGWHIFAWWRDRRRSLIVIQRGNSIINCVMTVEGGATAFIIDLAVINNSPRAHVVIRHFDLELLWNDLQFDWLPDPLELEGAKEYYSIPGTSITYPREMVLNHRSYDQGKLEPGDVAQGLLLGWGSAEIPKDLRHGSSITMKVSVLDQTGKRHSSPVLLRVDKRFDLE